MRSYAEIYIMAVFGVKYRMGLIDRAWCDELYHVIGASIKDIPGNIPLRINGFHDHVHVLFSTDGNTSVKDIIRRVKSESSRWINNNRLTRGRFEWQDGKGAFSYSRGQLDAVKAYIDRQWEHHRHVTFREEYEKWLASHGVKYTNFDLPESPR